MQHLMRGVPFAPEKAFLTATARVGDTTAAEGANVRAAIALSVCVGDAGHAGDRLKSWSGRSYPTSFDRSACALGSGIVSRKVISNRSMRPQNVRKSLLRSQCP